MNASRLGTSTLFTRSFHASSASRESAKQRIARLRKVKNLNKRAAADAEQSASRPHPVLGLKEADLPKWEKTKLARTLVPLGPIAPHPEQSTSTSTSSSNPIPKLLNFGLTRSTAQDLLVKLPELKAASEPGPYQAPKLAAAAEALGRIVDLRNANNRGLMYENRRRIVEAFQDPKTASTRGGPDTGRPEVQAALLTAKIRNVWEHLKQPGNSRDVHSRRAVVMLVHQRAKILKYLKRLDVVRYELLLPQLGLEKGAVEGEIVIR